MALRVPKAELPTGLSESMIKQLGAVPEPVEVLWHNPEVTQDNLECGKVGAWDAADAIALRLRGRHPLGAGATVRKERATGRMRAVAFNPCVRASP